MSAQHTPRPWATEVDRFETHIIGSDFVGGSATIATVYVRSNGPDAEDVTAANARLIAAAPDLLAALVIATESLCNLAEEARPTIKVEMYEAVRVSRAAIARATGGAA